VLSALLLAPTLPVSAAGRPLVSDATEEKAATLLKEVAVQGKDGKFQFNKPLADVFYPTPDSMGYTGAAEFISASTLSLKCQGKRRLVLLASFKALDDTSIIGGEITVLAIYKTVGGKPKLITAANVQDDRFTFIGKPPLLPYSGDSEALMISNTHSNAGESYESIHPVALQGTKLVSLCEGVGEVYCGRSTDSSIEEKGRYLLGKNTGTGAKSISFESTVTFNKYDPDDHEKMLSSSRKVFKIPLRFKNGKYTADAHDRTMRAYRSFLKSTGLGN